MFPRKINSRVAARQPLRGDVLFSSLPRMKKACALMFALIHILSCLKYEKGKKNCPRILSRPQEQDGDRILEALSLALLEAGRKGISEGEILSEKVFFEFPGARSHCA